MSDASYDGGNVSDAAAALGVKPEDILDFSGSCGSCEPPESVRSALADALLRPELPVDQSVRRLYGMLAAAHGVSAAQLLTSGDPAEFIQAVPLALRPRRAVIIAPCPNDYWRACARSGAEADGMLASEERDFIPDLAEIGERLSGVNMLFLGNPNNPAGAAVTSDAIRELAQRFPGVTIVVDERFGGPAAEGTAMSAGAPPANVILLRSLTCLYAMADMPLGYMVASEEKCEAVSRVRQRGMLTAAAMRAAEALIAADSGSAGLCAQLAAERERVRNELGRLPGLRVFPSQAAFLLLKITKPGLTSVALCERLLSRKVLARNASGFRGLDGRFLRVSIRQPGENDLMLAAMRDALDSAKWK